MSKTTDYEPAPDVQSLANKIIKIKPDLKWILEDDFIDSIGYVRSFVPKANKPDVPADCRKVPGPFRAYIPFDILITVYEPCLHLLSENQFKILLYHELKHIGVNTDNELKVNDHDLKDFYVILRKYGIDWNRLDVDVPDILQEGVREDAEG
jgi:hypothetical protein